MQRIKVMLVIPTLDRSGAEKQFTMLATGLPPAEFDVQAVALTRGGPFEQQLAAAEIPLTIIGKRWRFDPFAIRKLKKLVKREQPQVLHSWLFSANSAARLAVGRKRNVKTVVSERCVDSWKAKWQLSVDRRLIPRTDCLLANSRAVADFYENVGYPRELISVIPNAIECVDIADESAAVREELDLPADAKILLFVGRLAPQKRIHDLIWAFQLLRHIAEPVYFVVAGEGEEKDRLIRDSVHFECDHLMRFVGHRSDVPRLMKAADIFWLASDFEGQSNSLLEAMSLGLPVIASDIPPNRELIANGDSGFLVPVGDYAGYVQFAERILADSDLACRLGNAARNHALREHSVEKMIAAHAELYRRLAASSADN